MEFVVAVGGQAWWQGLLAFLWDLFVAVGVPVLTTLALVLVHRWLKVTLSDRQELLIRDKVDAAVHYADQRLKRALADGEEPKDKNAVRMAWAKEFLEAALIDSGLAGKVSQKLEDLIEARLGRENRFKSSKTTTKKELSTEQKKD